MSKSKNFVGSFFGLRSLRKSHRSLRLVATAFFATTLSLGGLVFSSTVASAASVSDVSVCFGTTFPPSCAGGDYQSNVVANTETEPTDGQTMVVDFTATSAIPTGGTISISAPGMTLSSTATNYNLFDFGSSESCNPSTVDLSDPTFLTITIPDAAPCAISAGDEIGISLFRINVGDNVGTTNTISMFTSSDQDVATSSDFTIDSVPGAPTNVVVEPGDTTSSITWDAPENDGASPITSYTEWAYDETTSSNAGTCTWTTGPLACDIAGLTNGDRYEFYVVATNGVGDGPASEDEFAVPESQPAAPTDVTAVAGNQDATVTWSESYPQYVQAYEVEVWDDTDPENPVYQPSSNCSPLDVNNETCVATGLTNGVSYFFVVVASNDVYTSEPSDSSADVVPGPQIPDAPTTVSAEASNGAVEVYWQEDDTSGNGSPVVSYAVAATDYTNPDNGGQTCTSDDPDITQCDVTGLTNGDLYVFSIVAINDVGPSDPAYTTSVVPSTVPGAPTNLTVDIGYDSAQVSWTAPDSNGGAAISTYEVTAVDTNSANPDVLCQSTLASSCDVTGLTPGDSYTFSVYASNTNGPGDSDDDPTIYTSTPSAPDPVVSIQATSSDGQVSLSWGQGSAEGSDITGYEIFESTTSGGETSTPVQVIDDPDQMEATITGLTDGTTYFFTVEEVYSLGDDTGLVATGSPELSATPTLLSAVSDVIVSAGSTLNGDLTNYQVTFDSSTFNPTITAAGESVTFTAPAGTTFSSVAGDYTIDGMPATMVMVSDGAGSLTPNVVTIDLPTYGAQPESDDEGVITSQVTAANVVNPTTSGSQSIAVSTSSDQTVATSSSYSLNDGSQVIAGCTGTTGDVGSDANSLVTELQAVASTGGTIYLTSDCTYALPDTGTGVDLPFITGNVTIATTGADSAVITVDSSDTADVFAVIDSGELTLDNTQINGTFDSAIVDSGIVTADGDGFSDDQGEDGGAIDVGDGGIPFGPSFGSLSAYQSTFDGNGSNDGDAADGGAIDVGDEDGLGWASISSSEFSDNEAEGGGAIANGLFGGWGNLIITNSSFFENTGDFGGSVVFNAFEGTGYVSILSSTLVNNATETGPAGGAITDGAGDGGVGNIDLGADILADTSENGPPECVGNITDDGYNISDDFFNTCELELPTSVFDPNIGSELSITGSNFAPFAYTPATPGDGVLIPDSPDVIMDGVAICPGTDATGTPRPDGGLGGTYCDPGAVEYPATVPSTPGTVSLTPGNDAITISWSAPSSDGGSSVIGYSVEGYDYTTSTPLDDVCGPSSDVSTLTSCVATGLTDGDDYSFSVVAINALNESDPFASSNVSSSTADATPDASYPGAPSIGIATASDGDATVTWTAPSDTGSSDITGYVVTAYDETTQETFFDACPSSDSSTATSCDVSITDGDSYIFSVAAINETVTGATSAESNAVVALGPPASPYDVTGTATDGSIVVSWVDDTSQNGGSPITGYDVIAVNTSVDPTDPNYTTDNVCVGSETDLDLSCTVTGLIVGDNYAFEVEALNTIGASAPSTSSSEVTALTLAGSPTSIDVDLSGNNGDAHVSWTAPVDADGAPIEFYDVGYIDLTTDTTYDNQCSTASTDCYIYGLTPGDTYDVFVEATNDGTNYGEPGSSDPATPIEPPLPPSQVTAVASDGTATVTWSGDANAQGSSITGYTVLAYDVSTSSTFIDVCPGADTSTLLTCTVTGLTDGDSYWFAVAAINAAGPGNSSAASSDVVPGAVPDAPTDVTAVANYSSATLSWTAPANTGTTPIVGYIVDAIDQTTDEETDNVCSGSSSSTSPFCVVSTLLTNGDSYQFEVFAINSTGTGAAGNTTEAVTPYGAPSNASNVAATANTDGSVSLSWSAPVSDGGSAITGYDVTAIDNSTDTPTYIDDICDSESDVDTTCLITSGLTNGDSYTFEVVALNAVANSSESTESNSVTPFTTPDAPTVVTATPGNNSLTISWTPGSDEGSTITGYIVKVDDASTSTVITDACGPASEASTATTCVVAGLVNGDDYTVSVKAINAAGDGTQASSGTVSPGAATQLVFSTEPFATTLGASFGTDPIVTIENASGDTVDTNTAVTLSISPSVLGATLSCDSNTVDAVDGVASFTNCSISGPVGIYTLVATATSLTTGTATAQDLGSAETFTSAAGTTFTVDSASDFEVSEDGGSLTCLNCNVLDGTGVGYSNIDDTDIELTGVPAASGVYTLIFQVVGTTTITQTFTLTVLSVDAPSNVVASSSGALSATVTWGPIADDVDTYTVTPIDVTTSTVLSSQTTANGGTYTMTFTGLVAGDAYTFDVVPNLEAGGTGDSIRSNEIEAVAATPSASNSGVSSNTDEGTSTATLGTPGASGSITATATGVGTVSVGQYTSAPLGSSFSVPGTATTYDVSVSPGSSFSSLSFEVCNDASGEVDWYNPVSGTLVPLSNVVALGNDCSEVTLTTSTTPSIADLVGSIFVSYVTAPGSGGGSGPSLTAVTLTAGTLPTSAVVGTNVTLGVTASSQLPVTYTLDAQTTAGACTLSGSTLTFTGAGQCVVDAFEAGNTTYAPAQQSYAISVLNAQVVSFTSTAPTGALVGGSYSVTATGGASGSPVNFTIDASSSGVCTISGSTVTFTGAGTCLVDAAQAATATYAAGTASQSFAISAVAPIGVAALHIDTNHTTLSANRVPISVTCSGATCVATLTLTKVVTKKVGKVTLKVTEVLGTVRFSLGKGKTAKKLIVLNAKGRAALVSAKKHPVTLTLTTKIGGKSKAIKVVVA